jgi:predicted phosphoribosyltransferase
MKAAIASLRHRRAGKIIAAVPVGPEHAVEEVREVADSVVTCAVGTESVFYVADYYRHWHDVTDDEVLNCLKEWRMRRSGPDMNVLRKKPENRKNR